MKYLKEFISSVFAGISISLGCMIYLLVENKIIGAMFFSLGLFLVLNRKYHLFTGKVANLIEEGPKYLLNLVNIWLGNLVGSLIMVLFTKFSKLNYLTDAAITVSNNKVSQSHLSAFLLAMLCGVIIFLAVDNFNKNDTGVGKYAGLFTLIPTFIICGFEHCVANMYYLLLANEITVDSVIFLLIVSIGNTLGSVIYKYFELKK